MKLPKEYHEKMISLLEKELLLYYDLEEILINEKNALSEFQFEILSEINMKKEGVLLNIIEVKSERNNLIKDICNKFKFKEENFNLTFLGEISDSELKKVYFDYRDKFKAIGHKIKNLNDVNKFTIETSLKFIEKSLNMLNQNVSPFTYSNYGKVINKSYQNTSPTIYTGKI